MKNLLTAIKSELQSKLTEVRSASIYITPDINAIPEELMFPCIGIKDGEINRIELIGSMLELTMSVTIGVHVAMAKNEANIIGSGDKKGVLDIVSEIHSILDENLLDVEGMQSAFSGSEFESIMFGHELDFIQQKKIEYKFVKEIAR